MDVTGHTTSESSTRTSRPVSIRDVAAAAGVSYQTVSRVINQSPRVKQSTRQLVLATISELGFRPNRAARTLAGGPIGSITVLTPNTTLFGQASLIQGIEEAARAAGFAVGIRVVESDAPQEVADAVDRAVEPGTALIVVAFDRAGTLALAAVPPEVPMVAAVETPVGDEGAGQPWVWTDDRKAAADATRFLLDLGHQTVHYIAIPSSTEHSQRTAGWRQSLREAGVAVPEPLQGGWDPHSGYEAGRVLAADPAVTAVLCGNDDLAVGVIRAMHEAGRAIPDSVSVVGFDDTPHAAYLSPALTTVRLDFVELGRECVRRLWPFVDPALATEPQGPRPEPELIVRESAGPAPGQPGTPPVRRRPRSHRSLSGPRLQPCPPATVKE
jgi:DNA-binding LacI/PurR family transcriptional regulator